MIRERFVAWGKSLVAGAMLAAALAVPFVGQGTGEVNRQEFVQGSGGGSGKVVFNDLTHSRVSFQDFHFSKVSQQDFHFVM